MTNFETACREKLADIGLDTPPLLIDSAPIPEPSAGEGGANDTIQAALSFKHWADTEAYLDPGEYPVSIWVADALGAYVGQVTNGGHDQWICNLRFDEYWIDTVGVGLAALGLDGFHSIWSRYRDYAQDLGTREALKQRWGFGPRDQVSKDIDREFFALNSNLIFERLRDRLLQDRLLVMLSEADLRRERHRIIGLVPGREQRIADRLRETEANDPVAWLVRKLCAKVGITPLDVLLGGEMPSGYPLGGPYKEFGWTIKTDAGERSIEIHAPTYLSGPRAKLTRTDLIHKEFKKKTLASMKLSAKEYERICDFYAISGKDR